MGAKREGAWVIGYQQSGSLCAYRSGLLRALPAHGFDFE